MRHLIIAAALALTGTAAFAADPIEGVWQTQPDEGAFAYVTIKPCGGAFCGTISRTFKDKAEYKSPNLGRQIVIDMAPQGGGVYKGKVWRPSNDKTYSGTANLSGKTMNLEGCIVRPLCASQTWVRIQ